MALENGYSYGMNLLISVDQGFNSLLAGSCDETLSSRIYREARDGGRGWRIAEEVVDRLFFWDKGKYGERHCQLANMVELMGGHMPKAMSRAYLTT